MSFYHIYKKYKTEIQFERKKIFPFFCKNVKLWPANVQSLEFQRQSLKMKKYLQNLFFNNMKKFDIR